MLNLKCHVVIVDLITFYFTISFVSFYRIVVLHLIFFPKVIQCIKRILLVVVISLSYFSKMKTMTFGDKFCSKYIVWFQLNPHH